MKIAVLITCHNRRETTLRCLRALFASRLPIDTSFHVFLVDDGSSDRTGDAVREEFPLVEILDGNGNLYWNGGMRKAFALAMERKFDFYLWLNDDTFLYPGALTTLLSVAGDARTRGNRSAVVVGSTHSMGGGPVNHGGIKNWRGLKSQLIEPQDVAIPCETMYGNCVLVPHDIASYVGNLDINFVHSIADVDYGLRVRKAGFSIEVMPGYAGTCETNSASGTHNDRSLSIYRRYQLLLSPKGLPPKPWFIFLWRHYGVAGLVYWLWTYGKVPLSWLWARIRLA